MGYPMAKNLRAGLGKEKTLLICDVSKEALDRFVKETEGQGPVKIISSGFEAAKAAVSKTTGRPPTRQRRG
jgi:3-hydroxyisobutyrate dehydrogenase